MDVLVASSTEHCAYCGRPAVKPRAARCVGCRTAYCSPECLREDRPDHAPECVALGEAGRMERRLRTLTLPPSSEAFYRHYALQPSTVHPGEASRELYLAVCARRYDVVKFYCTAGNVSVKYRPNPGAYLDPRNGANAFHVAAGMGDTRLLRYLMDTGHPVLESVRHVDHAGRTPLLCCVGLASKGHEDCASVLIRSGCAAIDHPDPATGGTALHLACRVSTRIARLLVSAGANVHARSKNGTTPLMAACNGLRRLRRSEVEDIELLRVLLDAGASSDMDSRRADGVRAIDIAASEAGSYALFRFLADKGADTTPVPLALPPQPSLAVLQASSAWPTAVQFPVHTAGLLPWPPNPAIGSADSSNSSSGSPVKRGRGASPIKSPPGGRGGGKSPTKAAARGGGEGRNAGGDREAEESSGANSILVTNTSSGLNAFVIGGGRGSNSNNNQQAAEGEGAAAAPVPMTAEGDIPASALVFDEAAQTAAKGLLQYLDGFWGLGDAESAGLTGAPASAVAGGVTPSGAGGGGGGAGGASSSLLDFLRTTSAASTLSVKTTPVLSMGGPSGATAVMSASGLILPGAGAVSSLNTGGFAGPAGRVPGVPWVPASSSPVLGPPPLATSTYLHRAAEANRWKVVAAAVDRGAPVGPKGAGGTSRSPRAGGQQQQQQPQQVRFSEWESDGEDDAAVAPAGLHASPSKASRVTAGPPHSPGSPGGGPSAAASSSSGAAGLGGRDDVTASGPMGKPRTIVHPDTVAPVYGRTPLTAAAALGCLKSIKALLRGGADPNRRTALPPGCAPWLHPDYPGGPGGPDTLPLTPLVEAALGGHFAAVEMLLANGADPLVADRPRRTLLLALAEKACNAPVTVQQQLVLGATPSDPPPPTAGALVAVMELLIRAGADIFKRDHLGRTLMHVIAGVPPSVPIAGLFRTILAAGGAGMVDDAIPFPAEIRTTLHMAVYAAESKLVRRTPLHCAAEANHLPLAQLLIAQGASLDAPDFPRSTPMHLAARQQHHDMVVLLAQAGARSDIPDAGNITPADYYLYVASGGAAGAAPGAVSLRGPRGPSAAYESALASAQANLEERSVDGNGSSGSGEGSPRPLLGSRTGGLGSEGSVSDVSASGDGQAADSGSSGTDASGRPSTSSFLSMMETILSRSTVVRSAGGAGAGGGPGSRLSSAPYPSGVNAFAATAQAVAAAAVASFSPPKSSGAGSGVGLFAPAGSPPASSGGGGGAPAQEAAVAPQASDDAASRPELALGAAGEAPASPSNTGSPRAGALLPASITDAPSEAPQELTAPSSVLEDEGDSDLPSALRRSSGLSLGSFGDEAALGGATPMSRSRAGSAAPVRPAAPAALPPLTPGATFDQALGHLSRSGSAASTRGGRGATPGASGRDGGGSGVALEEQGSLASLASRTSTQSDDAVSSLLYGSGSLASRGVFAASGSRASSAGHRDALDEALSSHANGGSAMKPGTAPSPGGGGGGGNGRDGGGPRPASGLSAAALSLTAAFAAASGPAPQSAAAAGKYMPAPSGVGALDVTGYLSSLAQEITAKYNLPKTAGSSSGSRPGTGGIALSGSGGGYGGGGGSYSGGGGGPEAPFTPRGSGSRAPSAGGYGATTPGGGGGGGYYPPPRVGSASFLPPASPIALGGRAATAGAGGPGYVSSPGGYGGGFGGSGSYGAPPGSAGPTFGRSSGAGGVSGAYGGYSAPGTASSSGYAGASGYSSSLPGSRPATGGLGSYPGAPLQAQQQQQQAPLQAPLHPPTPTTTQLPVGSGYKPGTMPQPLPYPPGSAGGGRPSLSRGSTISAAGATAFGGGGYARGATPLGYSDAFGPRGGAGGGGGAPGSRGASRGYAGGSSSGAAPSSATAVPAGDGSVESLASFVDGALSRFMDTTRAAGSTGGGGGGASGRR